MPRTAYFTPELFRFLRDLRGHNNREWFQANKARYDELVRAPMLRFIEDVAPRLTRTSPYLVADKRSVMRPNRDTRFSADKSPYKTNTGAMFRHVKGRLVQAPAILLHLEAGDAFAGMGLRGPDPATLKRVRDAIVADRKGWTRAISGKAFRKRSELTPDSLKRPPRGYDPDDPLIDELKRLHYCTVTRFTDREVLRLDFIDRFTDACRLNAPMMEFLTRAVNLSW